MPKNYRKGKGKRKPVAETASPSPSSSMETLKLLYPQDEFVAGPSNANLEGASASRLEALPDPPGTDRAPSPHRRPGEARSTHSTASLPEPPNLGDQADEEEDAGSEVYDYPKGAPTHYMVVDTLRKFTTLVNTIPSMKTRIAESRCLLRRTDVQLEKATPDARELAVTREYLETFLLAKMKKKRELWDGTGKMDKGTRKVRMAWLRAQRKTENEKMWRETNERNEKHGFEPEPFSVFASESDEEVIESLQTTPASSGSGSSKRSRESSDGAGVNGDDDTDDKNQRKRARL